mgnify:FL=1|tara:strand:+ start:6730 stop:7155 length:426 start_codon:yes stop_codon:yes gene_type:complete
MRTIEAPNWCSDAIPVLSQGWVSPSGEVMVSSRFTQAQIDEWQKANTPVTADDITIVEGKWDAEESRMAASGFVTNTMTNVDMPSVAAVSKDAMSFDHTDVDSLKDMNKLQLEALGREHGVELDRRKTKKSLLKTMKDLLS